VVIVSVLFRSLTSRVSLCNRAPIVKNECEKSYIYEKYSILEWFLKVHVTLKAGEMMLKIQLCWIHH